jgi:hypothetical protein
MSWYDPRDWNWDEINNTARGQVAFYSKYSSFTSWLELGYNFGRGRYKKVASLGAGMIVSAGIGLLCSPASVTGVGLVVCVAAAGAGGAWAEREVGKALR